MKYIYNLTYHIEEEVYPLWQEWIASRLEPLLRQSKCSAAKLLQIHTDALGSKAFGVQYEAEKEEDIVHSKKSSTFAPRKNEKKNMKKEIHPSNYRLVVFKDMSNDDIFITKSTVEAKDTIEVEGVEYPLVKLEISRTSHPYYTGKAKLIDTAGRIDKFKSKYAKFQK